jgi:hypothetical protein
MPETKTLPAWELRPVSYEPHLVKEEDEDGQPLIPFLRWSMSFGFALNIGHLDGRPDSPLLVDAHFSDMDKARGFMTREASPEQLVAFARLVLDVVEPHLARQSAEQVAR